MVIDFCFFYQELNIFPNNYFEDIISSDLICFSSFQSLLSLGISSVYRILSNYQRKYENQFSHYDSNIVEFLLKYFDKMGLDVLVIFSIMDFEKIHPKYLDVLASKLTEKKYFLLSNDICMKILFEIQKVQNKMNEQIKNDLTTKMNIQIYKLKKEIGQMKEKHLSEIHKIDQHHQILMNSITSILIPENITKIDEKLFCECTRLVDVVIPSSVETIERFAFSGCSSLMKIMLPSSVKEIGEYAFSECASLNEISIPKPITQIKEGTCEGCGSLQKVTFEDQNNLLLIECWAFSRCKSLAQISIPISVKKIDCYAFSGCSLLNHIDLDSSKTLIESNVFVECPSLHPVPINANLKK